MCTLTLANSPFLQRSAGRDDWLLRIACNRDELRTRPPALPPVVSQIGDIRVVMPIDPLGGGSWIAANEMGLALVLMNIKEQPGEAPNPDALSRGLIVLELIGSASLNQAFGRALELDPSPYRPFRLILADDRHFAEAESVAGRIEGSAPRPLHCPVMFSSSGLGEELVDPPRRKLFEQLWSGAAEDPRWQDQFHRHSWPDRRQLSVCMNRDDARTVSYTTIEISRLQIRMFYHADAPDRPAPESEIVLPRRAPIAA